MKLNELKPAAGSRSKRLRKGRGLSLVGTSLLFNFNYLTSSTETK